MGTYTSLKNRFERWITDFTKVVTKIDTRTAKDSNLVTAKAVKNYVDDNISSYEIPDESVTASKIAPESITFDKIVNGSGVIENDVLIGGVGGGIGSFAPNNGYLNWDGTNYGWHEDFIILKSSTPLSTKLFKITVNDSGTLTATEVI